ncbi:MAG: DUF1566 domain-containing protein, partial [Prevotellaceae bacterium]|nr:DUF1566 domain-containing protein [Prevotellaceae bacterium]
TSSSDYVELTAAGIAVAKADASSAAISWTSANNLCENLTLGGHTDWRLPAIEELAVIYSNKNRFGNFSQFDYWSSTQYGSSSYYTMWLKDGETSYFSKTNSNDVTCRCVRTLQ